LTRKISVKILVICLLISFITIMGCQQKNNKTEPPKPERSGKETAKPTKTKKPRPVVNLTDEQKKEVQKLIGEANKLASQKKHFEAIDVLDKALSIDPNNISAYEAKGMIARKQGMQNAAIEAYENVIELDPKKASGYHGLGLVYMKVKDYDSAIKVYQKLTQVKPKMDLGYAALGDAYFYQGQYAGKDKNERIESYKKSAENYENAIKIKPKLSKNYFKLVESGYMWYYLSKDPKAREMALKYAEEFKEKFPKDRLMTNIKRKIAQIEAVPK